MKTRIDYFSSRLMAIVIMLFLIISSCKKEEKPSLDGKWLREDDSLGVLITGSSGGFYSLGIGMWAYANQQGLLELGDLKFKEITEVGDLKWSYYELMYIFDYDSLKFIDIFWSDKGSITMSEDGQSIITNFPLGGGATGISNYSRQDNQ